MENRKPLAECADRLERLDRAIFGNGETEHSLLWRMANVEQAMKVHGRLMWATAGMVATMFSRLVAAVLESAMKAIGNG